MRVHRLQIGIVLQKFFRSPVAWIVLSLLFLILGMQLFSSMAGFETVPTSTTLAQLGGDAKLKSVKLLKSLVALKLLQKHSQKLSVT